LVKDDLDGQDVDGTRECRTYPCGDCCLGGGARPARLGGQL